MATTKVNTEFIAVNAISGTIIADGAITSTHLAANSVDTSELVTGSIDTIHIAANQVTSAKIVSNGVLTRHISDDQVTGDKLTNNITIAGTLTSTGAFTSPGIDDNADAIAITIDSSENVGIGTTSPDRKLDVSGTGNVYGKFQSTNATGAGIEVKDTGEDWLIQADDGTGSGGLAFYDLGRTAYRMFLDASGNLGIGTTSPSQKLDVNGTVELNNLTVGGAQGSDGQVLTSTGSGVAWEDASGGVAGISSSADATAITIDSSERVMIGSTTSAISANAQKLQIANAGATSVYHSSVMLHSEQNDGNANVNRISWSGGDGASANRVFSSIEGGKENSTSGEYGGMISMSTRPHGGTQTERMRITSAGNVGINETSPDFSGFGSNGGGLELDDVGSSFTAVRVNQGGTGDFYMAVTTGGAYLWGKANSPTVFGTNNTEKMRLDETGRLIVGGTATSGSTGGVTVSGAGYRHMYMWNSGMYFWNGANEASLTSGGAFSNASDERLKENITDIPYGLAEIKQLKPKKYNMIAGGEQQVGLIAQEVETIIPEVVTTSGEANMKSLSYGNLNAVLIKAIQELEARVKILEG